MKKKVSLLPELMYDLKKKVRQVKQNYFAIIGELVLGCKSS